MYTYNIVVSWARRPSTQRARRAQLYASAGCSFVVGTTCVDEALARRL